MYEKNETRYPDGAGIGRNAYTREMMGIKACKSVFVCGNLLVFLGAGIEDYHPEYGRHVITTVNNVRLAGSFVDAAERRWENWFLELMMDRCVISAMTVC